MIRRTIIGAVAAAVLVGASASSAFASSQTVTQAIKAQDKIIHASPVYKSLKSFKINTVAEAQKAIPKYEAFQTLLKNAATSVSSSSATAAQQKGKADWISGLRTLTTGIGYVVTELNDGVHGNQAGAKAAAVKAVKLIDAGNKTGSAGDKLLGLSTND